ncbi:GNAT family N-acetyltransferase [Streptomonospora nanhaiensis]|uniref:Sugar phosphate isomerase/epimerase n=1 Tax=Streptomonospora nanhaiensis TaxID=1323731 RepID=A0A853BLB2_9ACTN|nr:GNAT family N-acetyltransferase [Streptomonospora nanhaiensis]MBV2365607.1 GNAT family N-acetyltransferase [Streptomonospora nanhaiensis]MBX9389588.1 GNAT family N-acetyltransferase [Streptomonospora nanhaiensis]NYI95505.1 sugar phosphate isomerase/epimerase [Streptomonospora nanhaiensis]
MASQERPEVREAHPGDIEAIVALAEERRAAYRPHAPGFWDPAPDARDRHRARVARLVADPRALVLAARRGPRLSGCLLAVPGPSAEVYAPGGPLAYVEDFWVADPRDWWVSGTALVEAARPRLAARGAVRMVVESGGHDTHKRAFLWRSGLSLASEWYQAPLA